MDIKKFLKIFCGWKQTYCLAENLYKFSLFAMNIGTATDIEKNGEKWVMKYVALGGGTAVLFDVGANIGTYTQEFKKICPNAIVYCFEPVRTTFDLLSFNLQDKAKLNRFALGAENGRRKIYVNKSALGLSSLYRRDIFTDKEIEMYCEDIEIHTLDSYVEENNIEKIDFLKIDVEGHELNVLKGAINAIDRGIIKNIQIEFGGTCVDSRIFFRDIWMFLNHKYRIFRILKNGIHEIKKYDERFEIFGYQNYFFELKERI